MKKIPMKHVIMSVLMAAWLTTCTVIFHKMHIASWPAYLAVIYFFSFHFDTNMLKKIFGGGATGLLIGYTMPIILGTLTPLIGGEYAFYVMIAGILFTIICLGAIADFMFNYIAFTYSLLCLLNIKDVTASAPNWLITLFLGGALCISGIHGVVKFMTRNDSQDPHCAKASVH